MFTFTRFLKLPIEWAVVSVTVSGVWMTLLATTKGGERWREFRRARTLPLTDFDSRQCVLRDILSQYAARRTHDGLPFCDRGLFYFWRGNSPR